MSDVERHNSARWAKAAVPSYGDDWGDDYDDDQDENRGAFHPLPTKPDTILEDGREDDREDEGTPSAAKSTVVEVTKHTNHLESKEATSNPDLVLSIDNFMQTLKDSDDEDEDDDDDDENNDDNNYDETTHSHNFDDTSDRLELLLPSITSMPHSLKPTAPATAPATLNRDLPNSREALFLETYRPAPLNIVPVSKPSVRRAPEGPVPTASIGTPKLSRPEVFTSREEVGRLNSFAEFVPETPSSDFSFASDADSIQHEPEKLNVVQAGDRTARSVPEVAPKKEETPEELNAKVPTVTKKTQSDVPVELSEPENALVTTLAPPLVLSIDKRTFKDDDDVDDDDDSDSESDNWGYQGKNSDDDDESLENMINELKSQVLLLPNLSLQTQHEVLDTSSSHYPSADPTPTTPLDIRSREELEKDHQEFLVSSRRSSVRKPPTSVVPDTPSTSLGLKQEWKAEERDTFQDSSDEEDNMDYYEAVNGYLDLSKKNSPEKGIDKIDLPEPTGLQNQTVAQTIETDNNNDFLYQAPTPIMASFDGVDRRASTITTNTTNTFSMGNWQPNTNSFRDKFISDNDRDNASSFDFKPTLSNGEEVETELRSSRLSLSIPETLNASLPHINEDPDDSTESFLAQSHPTSKNDSIFKTTGKVGLSLFKEVTNSLTTTESRPISSMLDVLDKDEGEGNSLAILTASTLHPQEGKNLAEASIIGGTSRVVSSASAADLAPSTVAPSIQPQAGYPPYSWSKIMGTLQSIDRIKMLNEAKELELNYDSGLQFWLQETLKLAETTPTMHIGKIATAAYQNAPHTEIKRHNTLLNKVSKAKDKVESSGTSLGKKLFSRIKKLN